MKCLIAYKSDCTGGRIGDAVRYCQSEQNTKNKAETIMTGGLGCRYSIRSCVDVVLKDSFNSKTYK